MYLVPLIFIAVVVVVLILLVSVIVSACTKQPETIAPLVTVTTGKYYLVSGTDEHEITEAEAKDARKQGFKVIIK